MEELNSEYERYKRGDKDIDWNLLVEQIDKRMPNPEERAKRIKILLDPVVKSDNVSNWDMICFCLSFLAIQFLEYPYFTKVIKHLNRTIYQMHYQQPYDIGLLKYADDNRRAD